MVWVYILGAVTLVALIRGGLHLYHERKDRQMYSDKGAMEAQIQSSTAGEAAQEAEDEAFQKARGRMVDRARGDG